MNPEDALGSDAEHHSSVGVGDDSGHILEPQHQHAILEQQVQFLPRFPTYPLTRFHHSP
jgi:hypothetical protein